MERVLDKESKNHCESVINTGPKTFLIDRSIDVPDDCCAGKQLIKFPLWSLGFEERILCESDGLIFDQ